MRIVILGASGQIGSEIFDVLKLQHAVLGTSRKQSPTLLQFDPFKDDWSLLGKVAVLINCVGQIEPGIDSSFYKVHVELARLIIQNRELIGNPRIIQMSALGSGPDHRVEFLRTKGMADDYLLKFANTIVVRPSIVCTPGTMIVKKMLMLRRISRWLRHCVVVPSGFLPTRIQPVLGRDLAFVIDKLCHMEKPPSVLNVVGPERLSFLDLIKVMFGSRGEAFRILMMPKVFTDFLARRIVSQIAPGLINSQQYELLFEDNVADPHPAAALIGRPLSSTRQFFISEFTHASN